MQRTAILNVVGLTRRLIGGHTPRIRAFMERRRLCLVEPAIPAVTCTAQAAYVTGKSPREHGIVANGWYERDYAEHRFWKQPESLIQAEKLWDVLRRQDREFTCAKVFWWFNMHSTADYAVTPRPLYLSDGGKVFDIHTQPMDLRDKLKRDLGPFPFPHFWGPASDIRSTRWIAASAKWIEEKRWPTLSLVYLPHLDYNLQRAGLDMEKIARDLREVDEVVGDLIAFYERRQIEVVLLSEYGITSVDRPVHLNRVFREKGWLSIKDELGLETLDLGGCRVFALADHQLAHIYVNDPGLLDEARQVLEQTPGVEHVLGRVDKHHLGLNHPRAGDLIALADARSWFTYYYWLDDKLAPEFARCVDIHRKCGYDPVELFLDPAIRLPKLKAAFKLLKKKLGFRMKMDLIPLDATLVKGSHGRVPEDHDDWPVLIGDMPAMAPHAALASTDVFAQLLRISTRA